MDSYYSWNNNFAWNQEPYENFNAHQVNYYFPTDQNSYLNSYSYPYSDLEPQYAQEFSNEDEERLSTLEKTMEALMESQINFMQNTNEAISRLEFQMSRLATVINEQEMSEFSSGTEVNFENHTGCENGEENENSVFNSTHFESSQSEESKSYELIVPSNESMPKIDHVTFNESVAKVYKPKTPHPERLISRKQPSDFMDQSIEVNMIQELSMTQELDENRLIVENDPIDFFLNHLNQNWNESEYLDKVNEMLKSTTNKSTKWEHVFELILPSFEHVSEYFPEVNSKHNSNENFDYFQFPRPPENHEKSTLTCIFALLVYCRIHFRIYEICRYVHLFSFSPHFLAA